MAADFRAIVPGSSVRIDVHRIRAELQGFSTDERETARRMADGDPRLRKALADPIYNVTEALAGAPQLVARYNEASEEQRAVLNAAADAGCR